MSHDSPKTACLNCFNAFTKNKHPFCSRCNNTLNRQEKRKAIRDAIKLSDALRKKGTPPDLFEMLRKIK